MLCIVQHIHVWQLTTTPADAPGVLGALGSLRMCSGQLGVADIHLCGPTTGMREGHTQEIHIGGGVSPQVLHAFVSWVYGVQVRGTAGTGLAKDSYLARTGLRNDCTIPHVSERKYHADRVKSCMAWHLLRDASLTITALQPMAGRQGKHARPDPTVVAG